MSLGRTDTSRRCTGNRGLNVGEKPNEPINTRVLAILRERFLEMFGEGWDPLRLRYDEARREWVHPGHEPGTEHYFTEEDLLALYNDRYREDFDGYLSAVERSLEEDEDDDSVEA